MGELPSVFILAGGLGTRLRKVVCDRPKALAEAEGVPFLDLQLKWLAKQGVEEVVLLTGCMSKQIESYIGDGSYWDLNIRIIEEKTPLGTGGAILNALKILQTKQQFILLNGDSLTEVSLLEFYKYNKDDGLTKILAVYQANASRFGTVVFDKEFHLVCFQEKNKLPSDGWINAGIYYFPEDWFTGMEIKKYPVSLEKKLFPEWLKDKKTIKIYPVKANFIDIGTPESFAFFKEQALLWHSKLLH
jgi:NDP-sugar pyrophosphorylase family protein